jgi:plastocyanin
VEKKFVITTGIFILLIAGVILLRNAKSGEITTKRVPMQLPKEVTVTLDANGFSPKEVTIRVGTAVRWKNISGKPQTVNSDHYPTNQLHKELNFGIFTNNATVVYLFTKPGAYGYHNQFHPEQQGEVIVSK